MSQTLSSNDRRRIARFRQSMRRSGVKDEWWNVAEPGKNVFFVEGAHRLVPPTEPEAAWVIVTEDRHGRYEEGRFDRLEDALIALEAAVVQVAPEHRERDAQTNGNPPRGPRSLLARAFRLVIAFVVWVLVTGVIIWLAGIPRRAIAERTCANWGDQRGLVLADVTTGVPGGRSLEASPGSCEFIDGDRQAQLVSFDEIPTGFVHDVVDGGAVIVAGVLIIWLGARAVRAALSPRSGGS